MTDKAKEERDKVIRRMKKQLKQIDKLKEEYKALTSEEKKKLPAGFRAYFGDDD